MQRPARGLGGFTVDGSLVFLPGKQEGHSPLGSGENQCGLDLPETGGV